ncbi:MAG: GAF domain-containing protein, partial [Acidobacteriota bacterium]
MKTDRAARELEIVGAIAEALNSAYDVRQALDKTLSLVTSLLGFETGWVWLIDPDSGRFYIAAVHNLPPYLQEPVRMTGASCWCIEEFRRGGLTAQNIDIIECSRLRPAVKAQQTDLTRGLAHHATIPLYFQGKALGIMNVTAQDLRPITND